MDFYQINDLERLSGIKAHTIRIWEKRYAMITPYRTETNIRYYDDAQLKKLLKVTALINSGGKISKIAALDEQSLNEAVVVSQSKETGVLKHAFYINDFISAMLDFDEQKFQALFDSVVSLYGVEDAMVEVIYPFLHKTGLLWSVSETMPVQEHFASTIIKRKLFALIDALPFPDRNAKKFVLFLPANEWHELSLLFAEYIIKVRGFYAICLGQNVPSADIEYVISKVKPTHLLSFLVSSPAEQQINEIESMLSKKYKEVILLLSGQGAKLVKYNDTKNLKVLHHPKDILKFL